MPNYVISPRSQNFSGTPQRRERPVTDATADTHLVSEERPTLYEVGLSDASEGAPTDKAGALRVQAGVYERRGQKAKAQRLRLQAARLDKQKADPLARTKARVAARTDAAQAQRKYGGSGFVALGIALTLFGVGVAAYRKS